MEKFTTRVLALSILFSHSGIALGENHHMEKSIDEFNGYIAESEAICLQDILDAPLCQRYLSSKIEDHQLKVLFDYSSSQANHARLLSVFSPHASSVMLTPQQKLHLGSPEFQVALKWWLRMDTSQNSSCSFCPSLALDPLGHQVLTCKSGGDSIIRHNSLRDTFWESCKLACIAGQIEAGSAEGSHTCPADIHNWEFGKTAALDFTITSP